MDQRSLSAFVLAPLLVLVIAAELDAADRRPDPNHLTVMTLNAEFLWDGVDPEDGKPNVTFPWKGSPTEAQEHMQQVAAIIKRADPDILNLCEVENRQALEFFNSTFLPGRGYVAYFDQGTDTNTGQDVALLTRVDPEGSGIHYDDRKGHSGSIDKKLSKDYSARFDVGGLKIGLVGIHLLAQPNREDRKFQRQAQADAARLIAMDLASSGYAPIVMGDFNDYDSATDSRDHIDSMPISNVLATVKSLDPGMSSDDLINACSFVPKAGRYTSHWDKNDNGQVDPPNELTSIDHVLLPPTLVGKVESVNIPHEHDPTQHPDHFPIVVRFVLGGSPPVAPPSGNVVRIIALLPNPAGNENENEQVTLKNVGTTPASLMGWKLRDLAQTQWSLDSVGTLAPNEEKPIERNNQPMAMNNSGDTIDLLDGQDHVVQTVTFGRTDEGEVVLVQP